MRRTSTRYSNAGPSNFNPYAANVRTLTLPHHGSIHNYADELLTELSPEICVAPAAQYRNWQHPSPIVMATVAKSAVPVHVASSNASRLCEWVEITAW